MFIYLFIYLNIIYLFKFCAGEISPDEKKLNSESLNRGVAGSFGLITYMNKGTF